MKKIILASAILLTLASSCNSGATGENKSDTLSTATAEAVTNVTPSFEGNWKVVSKTENMFNNENGELLKGPFVDTISKIQVVFKSDSIISTKDGKSVAYFFNKAADGSLKATNVASKEEMTFTIDSVTQTHLYFTNTRIHLKDKYVINMKCVKE